MQIFVNAVRNKMRMLKMRMLKMRMFNGKVWQKPMGFPSHGPKILI